MTESCHAKTCMALGDTKAARSSLAEVPAMITSDPVLAWWLLMLAGVQGMALLAEGRTKEAEAREALGQPGIHASVERALAAAEPDQLVAPFLMAGKET